MANYYSEEQILQAKNEFEEIADVVKENITEETKVEVVKPLDLQEVYKINSDVVAWLRIAGTNINYPVMQSKYSPNYYLRRNIYKEYSLWGTPYLAEECDIDTSSNLIVYGNHIQNSKLFGELEKYKNRVFLESHKIIELITLDKTIYYETLILSTCEYSTPDGRLLVIAKKII